jgi:outer membrane beta-barrel protein
MRRLVLSWLTSLAMLGVSSVGLAQQEPPEEPPAGEEKPAAPAATPSGQETPAVTAQPEGEKAAPHGSWSDIVVVPRKAVLKTGRLELAPLAGVTLNDPLIRHWAAGGAMNYYFSDVFGVGVEGIYYRREITDRGTLIGLQYHRVPTMNEMHFAGALDFTYIPIYGKFAFFNHGIIHWEAEAIGGVGVTQTEIIPRNPSDQTFTNYDITPNLGIGGRLFLSQWLTIWFNFRDYVFPDKFERTDRPAGSSGEDAKKNADTQIVNNVVFAIGASFFLPTSFNYHTPK